MTFEDVNMALDENQPEWLNMLMGSDVYFAFEQTDYESIVSEGGNKFRFLNIFKHNEEGIIPQAQRDFFFKVINNIKNERFNMDLDGLAAINISDYKGIQWPTIERLFSPKFCVLWDVEPTQLGISVKKYGGIEHNGCRIVYVDDLKHMEPDKDLRLRLWNLLKNMFGIK